GLPRQRERRAAADHGAQPAAGHLPLAPRAAARGMARRRDRPRHHQRHHAAPGGLRTRPAAAPRRRGPPRRGPPGPRRRRAPDVRGEGMSSRPPSRPPRLPGYEYEQLLGSGGFADVFLYRQFRPQRRVAIKVLLSNVRDDSVRRLFDAEANVMAQMSTHPSIVTIHQAEVSDDHRPYLVMEYCPRPNYGMRFRKERITVAEALRVGVQIAGAVETAHHPGILHRGIQPANILDTEHSRPALHEF